MARGQQVNIDIDAIRAIESSQGIPTEDMLTTIAGALLYAYREYRFGEDGVQAAAGKFNGRK